MAETQASGFDRFNDALRTLDDQLQELRERFDDRRQRLTDDVQGWRKDTEARLRKTELYRRADRVRKDIESGVDRTYAQILDTVGLASKADLDKLNRKLNTISKKLNELSKESNGA